MISKQAKVTLSVTGLSLVAVVAGSALLTSPTGAEGQPVPARVWYTQGNLGTNPSHEYVGTADPTDLVLATTSEERIRILADGNTIIHHDLHVGEDLSVDGMTTLNDLAVENDLSIQGNLSVMGDTSLAALNASGNVVFNQDLTVDGHTLVDTLHALGTVMFFADASISGPASFSSNATFHADVSVAGDLDVSGTASVAVLEILGADLAEEFPFSAPVQPGMVVEIDPLNAGQLRPASGAYNTRVAGVVAGANEFSTGIVLGRGSGNEHAAPVALSGRVYVHVDATQRGVQVGDMLTTSDRPGYAMAVRDVSRMHGAVIGKAMTPLAQGETGMVLVLVNLQ